MRIVHFSRPLFRHWHIFIMDVDVRTSAKSGSHSSDSASPLDPLISYTFVRSRCPPPPNCPLSSQIFQVQLDSKAEGPLCWRPDTMTTAEAVSLHDTEDFRQLF